MKNVYILISVVSLVLIIVLFFISRKEGKLNRKPSALTSLGMSLVVVGMFFGNGDRWIGYLLMGTGIILSVIDLIRNKKRNKFR